MGIGERLIGEAEHWAGENGANVIRLEMGLERKSARKFYQGMGRCEKSKLPSLNGVEAGNAFSSVISAGFVPLRQEPSQSPYPAFPGKEQIMRFQFCPDCGGKLINVNNTKTPWPDMLPTCVIALVINEYGETALFHQSYLSNEYYNLISGYMKPGETAEEAAKRDSGKKPATAPSPSVQVELIGSHKEAFHDQLYGGSL